MTVEEKVYKKTVGLPIDIEMNETITGATGLILYIKRPDGTTASWIPVIRGTTKLRYVTTSENDLTVAGVYLIHPYLILGTWSGRAVLVKLTVYDDFDG